jgi:hypothetical protein
MEQKTTGYITSFKLTSKRKTTTWTTTEETSRWRECWDRNRPPWPKFVTEYDDDDDDNK